MTLRHHLAVLLFVAGIATVGWWRRRRGTRGWTEPPHVPNLDGSAASEGSDLARLRLVPK